MTPAYKHRRVDGSVIALPVGKAVCVGRNYAAHAKELGNAVPEAPILFMKPRAAFVHLVDPIALPQGLGECHHETELCVLVGATLKNASEAECRAAIAGLTLGLDLTLREQQNELKKKGLPWEIAKAFDAAAPMGDFLAADAVSDLTQLEFCLQVNGQLRQQGNTADMITAVLPLMAHISRTFTLEPGDVVMTGTPEGVAALRAGDELRVEMPGFSAVTVVA
jgi:2-keto-4-pentenoate hydratase/2-oxohepta-3-ene-1,7-dioic acid hydratase in catechol pathway